MIITYFHVCLFPISGPCEALVLILRGTNNSLILKSKYFAFCGRLGRNTQRDNTVGALSVGSGQSDHIKKGLRFLRGKGENWRVNKGGLGQVRCEEVGTQRDGMGGREGFRNDNFTNVSHYVY